MTEREIIVRLYDALKTHHIKNLDNGNGYVETKLFDQTLLALASYEKKIHTAPQ